MIAVQVLGPLEVTVEGAPADLGGPRQRCVLARLIAEHGRAVSADRLIEDLYADEAPPRAIAALQSYVSHLRRALEPGRPARASARVLVTSPPGYAVRLDRDLVDAWSFEEEVQQASALNDPAATHARLSSALAAWRGAAFQEFAGLSWADLEASRLGEMRLTAMEIRANAALGLGHAAQTIADLSRLTAEHPLREEAWRLLALALYQSGRQGEALGALRRVRARLAEDLGVDPGKALRELEEGILAQAPQLSAVAAAPPRLFGAAGYAPEISELAFAGTSLYVGRAYELEQVSKSALAAAAGRMRIVLVTGEAGAGKTVLADRVSRQLAAEGWSVTTGRCPEDEGAPAGWPWAEVLRQLERTAPPTDPQGLAILLTDTPTGDADVPAARFRLHRAVRSYLQDVSRTAPLLVVLDDLHRADGETLAILADLTAEHVTARMLVLASYRPAEVNERLRDLLAAMATREPVRLALIGLDPVAAGELIRATCARPVDEATVRVITERTGGNPFFIKETARLLDSEGELAASSEVPAGIRDVLLRRIARLPASAQTILRQAAVLGIETDFDVLGSVAGTHDDVLVDAVEAGLLTGLVIEPRPGQVRFAHALVRDTLYQDLSRLRRSRLHARSAEAIEAHRPGDVAALAYHLAAAGTDPVRTARYSRLAAEQAEQHFAFPEAVRLWEQAIASLGQASDTPARDRLELVLGLVGALSQAGHLTSARSYRRDAIRAALQLGDPVLVARVITAFDVPRAWFFREYGETDDELVGTVEQTLTQLPPGDHPLSCRLLVTLAFELADGDSERGDQAAAESIAMARRLGDPFLLTMAFGGRWVQCLSFRHDGLDERLRIGAELLSLPAKPVTAEALAHMMLMAASCGAADFAAADQHADQAAGIADRYDLPTVAAAVSIYRATRAALRGDPAAAEFYRQAGAEMDRLGLGPQHGAVLAILGRSAVLIMQDRMAEITAELCDDPRTPSLLPELHALGLAATGRAAEARVASPLHPIRPDRRWLFLTGIRGLLAIALADREHAEFAYQALLPYAGRPAGADTMLITLGPVAQILGDLARYLGLPSSEAHYQHALAIAEHADVQMWREAALRRMH
ncbi:MAG: BTAD domain-containing putative transcriptional regulator [Streptosporangiaceae bacterium]